MTPEQIEVEGMCLSAPQLHEECYICGDIAPYRNLYGTLCPYHFAPLSGWQNDNTPLLAQCAVLLDSLLGGPVVGSGIIDEIRRVRAELAKEGW